MYYHGCKFQEHSGAENGCSTVEAFTLKGGPNFLSFGAKRSVFDTVLHAGFRMAANIFFCESQNKCVKGGDDIHQGFNVGCRGLHCKTNIDSQCLAEKYYSSKTFTSAVKILCLRKDYDASS